MAWPLRHFDTAIREARRLQGPLRCEDGVIGAKVQDRGLCDDGVVGAKVQDRGHQARLEHGFCNCKVFGVFRDRMMMIWQQPD